MKSKQSATKRDPRTWFVVLGVAVWGAGCGGDRPVETIPVKDGSIPMMPMPMPGQATMSGLVLDPAGAPVAGAKLTVAETDATATSDAAGAFVLDVPSDSTVTVVASSAGYATTFRESVVLASQSTADRFDFLLLPTDRMTTLNALGTINPTTGGLVAVRLHSLSPSCVTAGAHLGVWPPNAGTIVYSRPSATGGLDEPDPTVDGVQAGVSTDVWIAGAISPGSMLTVSVQQTGCQLVEQSPSLNGMLFPGLRHPAAGALTMADLFLQSVP